MKNKKININNWRWLNLNKIRILIVEPDKEPYKKKIPHTLKDMQKVVGGLIEIVELEYNVELICNQ